MQFSKVERDVFAASTFMVVGDGASALFWEDKWVDGQSIGEFAPELYAMIPNRCRKTCLEACNSRWSRTESNPISRRRLSPQISDADDSPLAEPRSAATTRGGGRRATSRRTDPLNRR
ncbi:hypothetical protein QYE76_019405 [Lolium multiflorum]|uniref:Uncharacterized protein n=1 Tax=Lolium multiflorum TaxID=4521 RepID=A0AAD8R6X5_LOLMU|nr:hypothetical protein QYE76_019405 [Lolium multiflorum]